jgi:hypothetical protein
MQYIRLCTYYLQSSAAAPTFWMLQQNSITPFRSLISCYYRWHGKRYGRVLNYYFLSSTPSLVLIWARLCQCKNLWTIQCHTPEVSDSLCVPRDKELCFWTQIEHLSCQSSDIRSYEAIDNVLLFYLPLESHRNYKNQRNTCLDWRGTAIYGLNFFIISYQPEARWCGRGRDFARARFFFEI